MAWRSDAADVDEFADFVRARQHDLRRAAYLLCGDERRGDDAVERAFADLALHWDRIRDEKPDIEVRRSLYRPGARLTGPRASEPRQASGDASRVLAELQALGHKDRAVAILRRYEERTEAETAEILGVSIPTVRHHEKPVSPDALQDTAAEVDEKDFVDRAIRRAAHRRTRGRRTTVAVAASAALAIAALTLIDTESTDRVSLPLPAPSSMQSLLPGWDSREFTLDGALAQVGPHPEQVAALPRIDDLARSQLALPEVLGFGPDTRITTIGELGNSSAPVRAVLLRHTAGTLHPVLVRPTLSDPFVAVDTLQLVPNLDEAGRTSDPLEVTAIADDRRRVMFIQPGKVHVLDAFSGVVRTMPVKDRYLEGGGWVGSSIIVWSRTQVWRVSPETGAVNRLAQGAHPGPHEVQVRGSESMRILSFGPDGANTGTLPGLDVLAKVWGTTFTSPSSRVATGGFLGQSTALKANRRYPERLFQGVFTVDPERPSTARLLLAPNSEGLAVGCCDVLGWVYRDHVLVRWHGTALLVWDTVTGVIHRVATLPSLQDDPVPGSAAASVAIAP
ncbi:hypothetical protein N802_00505 [Knoellia sinensis KCTC 19936]|uniref:Uncharacterized protein n=1 Tax=Knoellia sinensis KCTC 19936 TaxID=1385520 RepID=A0A0A0JFZ1_9MICO|nr:sigma factor-like helix-turn-helix DNA-binding protein [Knoellia sinensis]KGN34987.1 hypothetical protein N802_00505 [Knoellia sinensis KCTC 19936]